MKPPAAPAAPCGKPSGYPASSSTFSERAKSEGAQQKVVSPSEVCKSSLQLMARERSREGSSQLQGLLDSSLLQAFSAAAYGD